MILTNNNNDNTMKKQNYDITPGQDKFLPVPDQTQRDYRLLRLHIDDLSAPIRRSIRPAQDSSWRTTASLTVALVILAATIAMVHCNS